MSQSLNRAYSLLTVKDYAPSGRTFSGIATTPTPDRVDDIIEPLGVQFQNPTSLLLFHDTTMPVGTVTLKRPTQGGIEFDATIAEVTEPGIVKDHTDRAAHLIKYGLIRAMSVGFRPLADGIERLKSGGLRFLKSEIVELSMVAVPANVEAVIHTVKAFDTGLPDARSAATGTDPVVGSAPTMSRDRDAIRAVVHRKDRVMTIQDQIKSFEATRQAKAAQMADMMTKAAEVGSTLDDAQADEYDELEKEVVKIDAHLKRLDTQEKANRLAARPVGGENPEQAAASRNGTFSPSVVTVKENLPPGIEYARLVICKAASFISMMNGEGRSAIEIAKERYPDNPRIQQVLTKTAVAAGNTTDATWLGPLVYAETISQEFVEFLRPQTVLGKFGMNGIPGLPRVPFNSRYLAQTTGGSGYWVGEGKPKPLTKFDVSAATIGFAKVAAISVITEESAKFSSPSAEALVRNGLAAALTARIDIDFIDPAKAAVSGVSPASITNGVTPMSPFGTDAAAVRNDLARIVNTYVVGNANVSSLVFIMPASLAMFAGLMRNGLGQREFPELGVNGGNIDGFPVITSQYATSVSGGGGNLVIAVNASEIFLADDGQVNVDISREASLEMNDAPTQDGGAGTGASLVSLWQNNLIGLRAERFINWKKARTTSVVFMDDVNWGSVGSPA